MEYQLFDYLAQWLTLWPTVLVLIVAGIYALKYGADWLVEGSANLGFRFGISAGMIGLTIVAFGTSAPELVVSVMTAAQGRPEICLGNVIGSNVANTTLILGATAFVLPLQIQQNAIKFDGPISAAGITLVFVLALMGNGLSRIDGIILLAVFATWMLWLVRKSVGQAKASKEEAAAGGEEEEVVFHERSPMLDLVFVLVGLVGLVIGAKLLVAGAVRTAEALGVPDVVVGLTVVAGGTSLPELAVCVAAALKRHGEMTVGNVMGSNIFNALLITGVAASIAPIMFQINGFGWIDDPGTLYIDIPFCVLVCTLVIPLMAHKKTLTRGKGIFLMSLYFIYIATLVVRNA